eukprot:PhM_4_TR3151/c0_g1_i3/m.14705
MSQQSLKGNNMVIAAAAAGGVAILSGLLLRKMLSGGSSSSRGTAPRAGAHPSDWSVAEVTFWCRQEFPPHVAETLAKNFVDGDVLMSLTDEQCVDMGLTALGLRSKLMRGVQSLRSYSAPSAQSRSVPSPKAPKQQQQQQRSEKAQLLHAQLDKIETATSESELAQIPAERRPMLLSACLQILQKVMTAVEVVEDNEKGAVLSRVKDVYQRIEDLEAETQNKPGGQYSTLLDAIHKGLSERTFTDGTEIAPFAEALEKLMNEAPEIIADPAGAGRLKECMDLLVQRSEELQAKETEAYEQHTGSQKKQKASNGNGTSPAAFVEQLDRIMELMGSDAFAAQPAEQKQRLMKSSMTMLERMAAVTSSMPKEEAVVVTRKIKQVFELISKHANGAMPTESPTAVDVSKETKILEDLYKALSTAPFTSMDDVKPFADMMQRLVKNDALLQQPETASLIEKCMQKLVERSQTLRAGGGGGARASPKENDDDNGTLQESTQLVLQQLDRIARVVQSEGFASLPADRKQALYATAASLLENIASIIEQAPPKDRELLMKRAMIVSQALQNEMGSESGEEEEDTVAAVAERPAPSHVEELEDEDAGDEGEIATKRKIDMLRRLVQLMGHRSFHLMEMTEQFEMMKRVMSVLQLLTEKEAADYADDVDAAIKIIDATQSRVEKSTDSAVERSGVVDLLPRITERLVDDNFVAITTRFQLACMMYIINTAVDLIPSVGGDARAALEEIVVPMQDLLRAKINSDTKHLIGTQHVTGSDECRFGFLAPDVDGDNIWRNVVVYNQDEDIDVEALDADPAMAVSVDPNAAVSVTQLDTAVVFAPDSTNELSARFLSDVLHEHGFTVIDVIAAKGKTLEGVLETIAANAQKQSHRMLVYSLCEDQDEEAIAGAVETFKATAEKLHPSVRFLGIHDTPNILTMIHSCDNVVDGTTLNVTPDASEVMPELFPFAGNFAQLISEALHEDGYAGTSTLSVEQLLNFVLSRLCPSNALNMSPRKGMHFVGRGLCVPYFKKEAQQPKGTAAEEIENEETEEDEEEEGEGDN